MSFNRSVLMPTYSGRVKSIRNYWHETARHGKLVRVRLSEGPEFRLLSDQESLETQLSLVIMAASCLYQVNADADDDGVCQSIEVNM